MQDVYYHKQYKTLHTLSVSQNLYQDNVSRHNKLYWLACKIKANYFIQDTTRFQKDILLFV